jgi:branched-subunit amino acid ABC-type transport system permease component
MTSNRFAYAASLMAAMLAVSACASVPPEQLAAAKAQVAPSAALTPALRNSIVEVIMKLDSHNIYFFGKPTYEYARISDLMFSRSLGGILTGSAEVAPYYCVEIGKGQVKMGAYAILVQRTETGYHLRAQSKNRSAICYIEPGHAQEFPELLARKNAPDAS